MKNHNSIKCFSFMTCTALTTLVKPVAHDASKSNIFTHYIALNTTIITQYSDQQICNSNSFNKSRATIAFICEFVFQTTVSTKRYIVPQHLSSMADNLAWSLSPVNTFVLLQNISTKNYVNSNVQLCKFEAVST